MRGNELKYERNCFGRHQGVIGMNQSHTIALTGANGFIGKQLQQTFDRVVVLRRDDSVDTLLRKLEGVDTVINLAGAPIVRRWSESYKRVLYESRVLSTRKLVEAINRSDVGYFVSTSAVGIYPNDKACDERYTEYAEDFLAKLCMAWEAEARKCAKPTAVVRLGVVLGKEGGALQKMLLPFKLGLGGVIGDGKMMTSWIHIADLIAIYRFLMARKAEGVYNAVSPHPVSNRRFTKALGSALHRPTFVPLPTIVLKMLYGEAATVLIDSKEVYPRRLEALGFAYGYETIETALEEICEGERI